MKKIIYIVFTFSVLSNFSFGQDYKVEFEKLHKDGDTTKQIKLLKKWETEDSNNPELYTSYFNYYFFKSRQEFLSTSNDEPYGESLQLKDSTGKVAGFIGSVVGYNREILQKGFDKIDVGIMKYPNRLDMRFGKIYALGEVKEWDKFTNEIIKTIQYSNKNNNEWTWTNNEVKQNGKEFLLSSIQDYQLTLYNTDSEDLLIKMRIIADEILKIYPNHIESLSNISITHLLVGEYDKAIEALLIAEKISPKDVVILNNIAHGYKLKNDIENSLKYYEKMLTLDDENAVNIAKEQIELLQNKH